MQWNHYQRSVLLVFTLVATAIGIGAVSSAADRIAWVEDFKEAKAQSKKQNRPIFVAWEKPGATPAGLSAQAIARSRQFICVKLDWEKDKATIEKLRIDVHEPDSNTARWRVETGDTTPGYGYLFTSARPSKIEISEQIAPRDAYTGNVQGRIYRDPTNGVLVRMMDGVLKAHGLLQVKAPKQSKARPFRVPHPKRDHPPHAHSWRECSTCEPALKKALEFLKEQPVRAHWYDQWLGTFFCGFTYMMEGKSQKELEWCVDETRKYMLNTSNVGGMVGYRNWFVSMSALLVSEYSLRYGLTKKNKAALEWAHQFAIEEIDNNGGWFHHAKHGYDNYAADISMIGCMFYATFLEMEALGIQCEPGLTLAESYVREMADDRQSIGYASNNRGDGAGNVGKNGLVLMGLYATGNEDDPLTRTLGQFLTDHPQGPPQGHASSFHHFFGAAVGLHRMGPEHYAPYAGMWLHRLIECQHEDGSIGRFPHDVGHDKVDEAFEKLKVAEDHDWVCTGILAGMILMTEPGVFSFNAGRPQTSSANSTSGAGRKPPLQIPLDGLQIIHCLNEAKNLASDLPFAVVLRSLDSHAKKDDERGAEAIIFASKLREWLDEQNEAVFELSDTLPAKSLIESEDYLKRLRGLEEGAEILSWMNEIKAIKYIRTLINAYKERDKIVESERTQGRGSKRQKLIKSLEKFAARDGLDGVLRDEAQLLLSELQK